MAELVTVRLTLTEWLLSTGKRSVVEKGREDRAGLESGMSVVM